MLKKTALFILTGAITAVVVIPRPVDACTVSLCSDVTHFPGERAPANLRAGLASFYLEDGDLQENDFELHRVDVREEMAVPISIRASENRGVEWRPEGPLQVGGTYRLRGVNDCSRLREEYRQWERYFRVTEPAPLPTRLGSLTVDHRFKGNLSVHAGNCGLTGSISADQIMIGLELYEEAVPWWDLLEVRTYVDGELWNARSSGAIHRNRRWHNRHRTEESQPPRGWARRDKELLFAQAQDE